jgi:hypothetical protein
MKKKRKILWKKVFLILSTIIIIVLFCYIYFKTGFFTIHNYEITGVKDQYQKHLQEKFKEIDKENYIITAHK